MYAPGASYINDPIPYEILHVVRSLKFEICQFMSVKRLLLQVIKKNMMYKPCPEFGKHKYHNKLKCAECGVCLHAHSYYSSVLLGMWSSFSLSDISYIKIINRYY